MREDRIQVSRGGRVTNHLVFRFKDGSVRDETAVFSQRGIFRLLSYHLLQKGPTSPYPIEVSIPYHLTWSQERAWTKKCEKIAISNDKSASVYR